jgi:hypothetical protein
VVKSGQRNLSFTVVVLDDLRDDTTGAIGIVVGHLGGNGSAIERAIRAAHARLTRVNDPRVQRAIAEAEARRAAENAVSSPQRTPIAVVGAPNGRSVDVYKPWCDLFGTRSPSHPLSAVVYSPIIESASTRDVVEALSQCRNSLTRYAPHPHVAEPVV